MAVRTNHVDEKLPLYATEALSPSRLHQLKAAAVSDSAAASVPVMHLIHIIEKLPLYATEARSPSRLHQLKAAAVSVPATGYLSLSCTSFTLLRSFLCMPPRPCLPAASTSKAAAVSESE